MGIYICVDFRLVVCRRCGLIYVNPRIAANEIPELYDDAYYRGEGFDPSAHYDVADRSGRWEYRFAVAALRAVLGSLQGREVLDIGCGTGPLVRLLVENGAAATGIDTSQSAIAIGRRRGLNVRVMELRDASEQLPRFDAVVMMEVIEHVTRPVEMLRQAAALLKSGGYLFVSTGNWSLISREIGTPYIMPEGHICYYTPVTLSEAFRRAGLRPVNAAKNRFWIGYRIAERLSIPDFVTSIFARIIHRVAPQYGPFPFGQLA